MQLHYFFSVFVEDGSAYGKADIAASKDTIPGVGDSVDPTQLGTGTSKISRPEHIDLTVERVALRDDYVAVELSDAVLANAEKAAILLAYLSNVGFDCDTWSEQ